MRWGVKHPPADPHVSFVGQTVLVTGANTGLGFEAAVKFSAKGASRLILGVRSVSKGEDTKRRILAITKREQSSISIVTVDLSDFGSVQAFVPALEKETAGKLDIALLNAGQVNPSYQTSKATGWEMTVQVNALATALMAIMLLPLLRRTARTTGTRPHLTIVNSYGHAMVEKEWLTSRSLLQAANDPKGWDSKNCYVMTKLLCMVAAQVVARAATGTGTTGPHGAPPEIIVNTTCPGVCKTDIGRNFGLLAKIAMVPFQAIFNRTAEQGSRSLVGATALGPESHGKFWVHDYLSP